MTKISDINLDKIVSDFRNVARTSANEEEFKIPAERIIHNRGSSVFLEEMPSISYLKAATFFWENICVYESFIQNLKETPDTCDVARLLLEKGVLKIVVNDVNDFERGLYDKIYAGFDIDFLEFLHHNAEKIIVISKLPPDIDELVKEASAIEYKDKNLQSLIEYIVYKEIEDKYLEALYQNERLAPFDKVPKDFLNDVIKSTGELIDFEYKSRYERHTPEGRYNFEWRNLSLFKKFSVSSVLYSSIYELPYYYYKFCDFRYHDASHYIKTLNATMPFVKRESIDEFDFDEILKIRKNKRWENAMIRLGEITDSIMFESSNEEFEKEVKDEIVLEFQNALGEAEVCSDDLFKNFKKGIFLTGIAFVPIVGTAISTLSSILDPVVSYFRDVKKQKTLPFFLNDIRKI